MASERRGWTLGDSSTWTAWFPGGALSKAPASEPGLGGLWTRWMLLPLNTAGCCSACDATWCRRHWCRLVNPAIALTKGPHRGHLPPLEGLQLVWRALGGVQCQERRRSCVWACVELSSAKAVLGAGPQGACAWSALRRAGSGPPRPAGPFRGRVSSRDLMADQGVTRLGVWGPGIPQVRSPKEALPRRTGLEGLVQEVAQQTSARPQTPRWGCRLTPSWGLRLAWTPQGAFPASHVPSGARWGTKRG